MSAPESLHVVNLAPAQVGICPGIQNSSPDVVKVANRLLQKNHDEFHIFWRDFAGHNHTAHNVLTRLALGADETDLENGFVDNKTDQRPRPPVDEQVVRELGTDGGFYKLLGEVNHYTNFLVFFEREIDQKGWREVIQEYCFGRTRNSDTLLARLFEGAFHPIIHLGLGVEFEQPSIIAEALSQAASDHAFGADPFMRNAEARALQIPDGTESRLLVDLIHEVRINEKTRTAARWDDFQWKMKNGVLGRGMEDIAALAAQYRVKPDTLERQTAEMISCCSYFAGAAQKPGKARKIDFFYMHDVTSSIFNTVFNRQSWIRVEDKVRLLEHKARFDLVWYATCGAPELHIEDIENFTTGASADWGWDEMFRVSKGLRDDGHVAKFVRAVKNGEEVSKEFEDETFPVKGDMWLKLAHMAYETTVGLPDDEKWLPFVGFDQPWGRVPDLKEHQALSD
ncbi:hypothetical protein BKA67DRAFT_533628 [Truncatella angustata]|uniref:Uncharacterized protein n=1 Tax=Truncatella angustata TaxID=152316 RepID=A0A9P9A311_9PEZI|nr:uncharacterized protein BKA67DRAFT_533628 [Truncatella angustata]KAH6658475.1 hypothetical protein BKA67DRAFT_533628 [Truncatella angustata]KAH8195384.1 hypothetical protein TruAng_010441 [Truncatella angustata]